MRWTLYCYSIFIASININISQHNGHKLYYVKYVAG